MAVVRFEEVRKHYPGGFEALRGVSFEVQSGEMLFITGHSGAGKTTVLRLIAALDRASSGRVTVHDQDITRLSRAAVPFLRRNLGLVLQDQKLLDDRTVFDNVVLPLSVAGFPTREAAGRVRAALDKVGLLAREGDYPLALSAGEQQRVCIARAVVGRPGLLIADEPTAHVDPDYANQILEVFRAFNRVGVTVIVVSHDAELVARYASRVIGLKDGSVVA